jgi:hypothetical protein
MWMKSGNMNSSLVDTLVKQIFIHCMCALLLHLTLELRLRTLRLLVHNKTTANTKIFICGQQLPLLAKTAEAHSIGMCFQNLIPAPEHITIDIIADAVMTTQK